MFLVIKHTNTRNEEPTEHKDKQNTIKESTEHNAEQNTEQEQCRTQDTLGHSVKNTEHEEYITPEHTQTLNMRNTEEHA